MNWREHLDSLCGGHSEKVRHVRSLAVDGQWFIFATDGRAFLAASTDSQQVAAAMADVESVLVPLIRECLASRELAEWKPLQAFMVPKNTEPEKCEVCDGDGNHTCPVCDDEHVCGNCDGSGRVTYHRPEPVTIGKANYDRNIFHRFADGLSAERVRITRGGKNDPLVLADVGGQWVLGIMPTGSTAKAKYEVRPC